MWLDYLSASMALCDVENTGLGNHDCVVGFGGIGMTSADLAKGRPNLAYLYLVFRRLIFVTMDGRRAAQKLHPGRGRS